MQLPINVKEVVDAATGYSQGAEQSVSVSVYLDDTAPADLIAHVRSSFASASPKMRITMSYIAPESFSASESDDAAVIVAGVSEFVGEAAAAVRAAKTPVMVVTTLPVLVGDLAACMGYPIPEGDIVSPATQGPAVAAAKSEARRGIDKARAFLAEASSPSAACPDGCASCVSGGMPSSGEDGVCAPHEPYELDEQATKLLDRRMGEWIIETCAAKRLAMAHAFPFVRRGVCAPHEPYELDEQATKLLDRRMGEWIIETCAAKRLAMAHAFPFVRRPLAVETVNMTSVQNAGVGVVVFIPGADLPLMTLNQAKMLLQIAAAYGQPMSIERAKELVGVVGGAFACRAVARNLVGVVPALGWLIKGMVGYTGTLAMGHAAIEYFEHGGGAFACRAVARNLVGVVPALGWLIKGMVGYTGTLAMGHAAIEYFEHGGGAAGFAKTISSASAGIARAAAKMQSTSQDDAASDDASASAGKNVRVSAASAVKRAGAAVSSAAAHVAPVAAEAISAGARSFAAGAGSLIKSASAMMGASK